jgi:uncharacterized membrane protein YdbT with pleckstrin-like domain
MGSYVNSHLDPGETVTYEGNLHWVIYLTPMILLGLGIGIAVSGLYAGGLALCVMGFISALISHVRMISSEFAVTNRRVVIKTGWLSRRTIELNMSKVESIQVDQDIFGRLLNYGTITVIGTGGTKEPFPLIDNPIAFRHAVQKEQG